MKRNLKRYHRNIFFPETFENDIELLLKTIINRRHWAWGFHAVKKLLESLDRETATKIISFVYHLKVCKDSIFEVYYLDERIEKFCIRVSLDEEFDLILVISRDKTIITLYINFKDHLHTELDESLYQKE